MPPLAAKYITQILRTQKGYAGLSYDIIIFIVARTKQIIHNEVGRNIRVGSGDGVDARRSKTNNIDGQKGNIYSFAYK